MAAPQRIRNKDRLHARQLDERKCGRAGTSGKPSGPAVSGGDSVLIPSKQQAVSSGLFAFSMASSNSCQRPTERIGPNTSSRHKRIPGSTSAYTVGSIQNPLWNIAPIGRCPPLMRRAPSAAAEAKKEKTLSYWTRELTGPHSGRRVCRIAELKRAHARDNAIEHGVVNISVQQQPAGRAARLALPREIHSAHGSISHDVRVYVRKSNQRVLAAELERVTPPMCALADSPSV